MIYISPREDDLNGLIALYGFAPTTTPTLPPPTVTPTPTGTALALTRRVVLPLLARD